MPDRIRWAVEVLAVDRFAPSRSRPPTWPGDLDDKIFAINVNPSWAGPAAETLDRLRRQLRPHGALYLCYEPPASRVDELTDKLITTLRSNGLITDVLTATTQRAAPKLCPLPHAVIH